MKKYIKPLNEYEDADLLDLMGDLGDIGFENYQGWVFSWDSPNEGPLTEVMIAPGPREAFQLYKDFGWFAADLIYAENKGKKFTALDDVFDYLKTNKIVTSYSFIWGLIANKGIKNSEFYQAYSEDPIAVGQLILGKFSNAAEVYSKAFDTKRTKRLV